MSDNEFFIVMRIVDGEIKGHAIRHGSVDKEEIASLFAEDDDENSKKESSQDEKNADPEPSDAKSPFPESFREVERAFSQGMLMYRKSVVETIKFAPLFASLVLRVNVKKVATSRGTKRDDLSSEGLEPDSKLYDV